MNSNMEFFGACLVGATGVNLYYGLRGLGVKKSAALWISTAWLSFAYMVWLSFKALAELIA